MQGEDLFIHLNITVASALIPPLRDAGTALMYSDVYDISKGRKWGPTELLNDFAGLALANQMAKATITQKYAEFQYNVTTLLCTPR